MSFAPFQFTNLQEASEGSSCFRSAVSAMVSLLESEAVFQEKCREFKLPADSMQVLQNQGINTLGTLAFSGEPRRFGFDAGASRIA